MAFNVRPMGDTQEFELADSIKSGDVVRIGNLVGVALTDAGKREDGKHYATVALEGVAGVTLSGSPKAGDVVVVDKGSNGKASIKGSAAAGDTILGYVLNPNKSAAGTYDVKIANGIYYTA